MRIALNMATTIDGKIAPATRGPVKLGSLYDSQRMEEIRAQADAVVVGGETFRAHPKALTTRWRKKQPMTVVVSRTLTLPKRITPLEKARTVRRLVLCGSGANKSAVRRLELAGITVLRVRTKDVSARDILRALQARGVRRVLLEGGGELNALFLEKNLVERIYLTFCPALLGGSAAPTFFEGTGFSMKRRTKWRLKEWRKVGQELYLIYDRAQH